MTLSRCCHFVAITWRTISLTGSRCRKKRIAETTAHIFRELVSAGSNGKWIWPGYGENSRVLKWICEGVDGSAKANETAIGNLPSPESLDLVGLNLSSADIKALLEVDEPGWKTELEALQTYFEKFGGRLPRA